jgi:UDP-N-acetylglucosamine 3-dehydrogenase
MTRLRLGLIGHGPWGRNIERTLASFDDVSLTLIGRTTPRPTDLDAVLIATPGPTHADVALPYIEKGIATFIEKPMATSVADAERIAEAARASGALVFVGHTDLYNPAFRRALDVLPTLGAVRHILFEGMNDRPLPHSSALWEWLPHPLAAARTILRTAPTRAAAWNLAAGTAKARFDYASAFVLATVSWQSPIKKRSLTVTCEAGELVFDDTQAAKLTLHRDGQAPMPIAHGNDLPLTLELRAFVDAVAAGAKDRSQLEAAVTVTRAIAAAERSAAEGGTAVALPT